MSVLAQAARDVQASMYVRQQKASHIRARLASEWFFNVLSAQQGYSKTYKRCEQLTLYQVQEYDVAYSGMEGW